MKQRARTPEDPSTSPIHGGACGGVNFRCRSRTSVLTRAHVVDVVQGIGNHRRDQTEGLELPEQAAGVEADNLAALAGTRMIEAPEEMHRFRNRQERLHEGLLSVGPRG